MQYDILNLMKENKDKKFDSKQLAKILNVTNLQRIQIALYTLWKQDYLEREEFVKDKHRMLRYWIQDGKEV